MATQTQKANGLPVNPWLLVALGAILLAGVVMFVASCSASKDPTMTAAPPLPKPAQIITKSPEVMAKQKAAMGEPANRPPRPAFPMQN